MLSLLKSSYWISRFLYIENEMDFTIEKMIPNDWDQVRSIFMEGISTGHATFETNSNGWDKWNSSHLNNCRLVAKSEGSVLGWAALSRVSDRQVYSGIAEVSVYVAKDYHRQGVGFALLKALIKESEDCGIWTLQAGIFPENTNSLDLHRKLGFKQVGTRKKLGKMSYGQLAGAWRDVILMERRSNTVGID